MIALLVMMALAGDTRPRSDLKRDAVMEFAACVRKRSPDRVDALLATKPGSDDERRRMEMIARSNASCVRDRIVLSMPGEMLRGQFAELVLRADPALVTKAAALVGETPLVPDVAAIDRDETKVPAGYRDTAIAEHFRRDYARCVVRANPQMVAALVTTQPASVEERMVLTKGGDTLMRCMPTGIAYHLKPAELRPYLMYQLHYRLVGDPQWGGKVDG